MQQAPSMGGCSAGQGMMLTIEDAAVLAWHLQQGGLNTESMRRLVRLPEAASAVPARCHCNLNFGQSASALLCASWAEHLKHVAASCKAGLLTCVQ